MYVKYYNKIKIILHIMENYYNINNIRDIDEDEAESYIHIDHNTNNQYDDIYENHEDYEFTELIEHNRQNKHDMLSYRNKISMLPIEFELFCWIKILDLSSCELTTLSNLPANLEKLNVSYNSISCINHGELPHTITHLNINHNNIVTIDYLPTSLIKLKAAYNGTNTCNFAGLVNLQTVYIESNNLTHVPFLEDSIVEIDMSSNYITSIDNLENKTNLTELNVSDNKLTNINKFPINLELIDASDNQIKIVTNIPPMIKEINLKNNIIIYISQIPESIRMLDLENNNIKHIFSNQTVPRRLEYLNVTKNPDLSIPDVRIFSHIDVFECDNDDFQPFYANNYTNNNNSFRTGNILNDYGIREYTDNDPLGNHNFYHNDLERHNMNYVEDCRQRFMDQHMNHHMPQLDMIENMKKYRQKFSEDNPNYIKLNKTVTV